MSNGIADLKILFLFTIVAVPVLIFSILNESSVGLLVGVPLLFVISGYAILATIVPTAGPRTHGSGGSAVQISGLEWWTLAVAIGLLVVPAIAIVLVMIPVAFGAVGLVGLLGFVSGVALLIAAVRRSRLSNADQYRSEPHYWYVGLSDLFRTNSSKDVVLSGVLIVTFLLLLSSGFYAMNVDHQNSNYTELYILSGNETGELVASEYRTEIEPNEELEFAIGVSNHEGEAENYTVVVQEQQIENDNVTERTELRRIEYRLSDGATGYGERTIEPMTNEGQIRISFLLFLSNDDIPNNPTKEDAYRYTYVSTEIQPNDDEAEENSTIRVRS